MVTTGNPCYFHGWRKIEQEGKLEMLRKGPTRLIIETTKEMLSLLPKYITYCHSGNSLEATQEVREQSTTIGKAKKTILNLPLQEKSHKGGKKSSFLPPPLPCHSSASCCRIWQRASWQRRNRVFVSQLP